MEWLRVCSEANESPARPPTAAPAALHEDARQEAQLAVELSSGSDFTSQRGDALLDLAVVLQACGDGSDARRAAAEALACFAAKGNVAASERAAVLARTPTR